MKLQCQVEVVNRLHSNLNLGTRGKYLKSTLALGKEPKNKNELFILHFSTVNKTGVKYKVKNMKQVFAKFLKEGKATLRFTEPPHDLCIKSEAIQLKCFMKLLQRCVTGDATVLDSCSNLSNISVTPKDVAPTKLVIKDRSEFPSKGLPRTLETLTLAGLKLCNFRRDILMLKQLTVLDLSNNEIEKLPPEFGRMSCLAELNLANNKLGAVNMDWRWLLGDQITKSLRLLDVSGNHLKSLPKGVWKLQRLVTLTLQDNDLEELPATLGRISSLRYLNLSKNKISGLPCSLLHCRLEHIDLSSNNFARSDNKAYAGCHNAWYLCVGSLVQVAAKAVLKHKIYYAPNLIPRTLVDYLDDSNLCLCGDPALTTYFFMDLHFDPKEFFITVVSSETDDTSLIKFNCYFCSTVCIKMYFPPYPRLYPHELLPIREAIIYDAEDELLFNPEHPANPEQPANPEDPANLVNPANPEQPANPVNPANPEDPANPEQLANLEDPVNPAYPEDPINPEAPVSPEDPINPEDPVYLVDLINPEDPVIVVLQR